MSGSRSDAPLQGPQVLRNPFPRNLSARVQPDSLLRLLGVRPAVLIEGLVITELGRLSLEGGHVDAFQLFRIHLGELLLQERLEEFQLQPFRALSVAIDSRRHLWQHAGVEMLLTVPLSERLRGRAVLDGVHRVLDRILVVVEVVRPREEFQTVFEDAPTRWSLRHGTPDGTHDNAFGEAALQIPEAFDLGVAWPVAQVPEVQLVVVLRAGDAHLLTVCHDDEAAYVPDGVVERIILATQNLRNGLRQVPQRLALGVEVIPLPVVVGLQLARRVVRLFTAPLRNRVPLLALGIASAIRCAADHAPRQLVDDHEVPSRAKRSASAVDEGRGPKEAEHGYRSHSTSSHKPHGRAPRRPRATGHGNDARLPHRGLGGEPQRTHVRQTNPQRIAAPQGAAKLGL
mmetsp:Transcript_36947/g.101692  ORF Transcript_36947/g.101692 Transcript_36947/m.101692 type:complete len:400 (-) Transcript_36947:18-1217(-)